VLTYLDASPSPVRVAVKPRNDELLPAATSVVSHTLVHKVFLVWAAFLQPRPGRKIVAQGISPGVDGPHPAFGTPLPPERERGQGVREGSLTHGLCRGLHSFARSAG